MWQWIPGRSWVITTKANPKSRVCRSRDLSEEADDLREISRRIEN